MKNIFIITSISVLCATVSVSAQTPVPDSDTTSVPIQEGDPAIQTLPPRMDYVEDKRRIAPEELPAEVRETLESNAEFKDWREATLFHEQNKDEYIVEFEAGGQKTSYRFNKEGLPVIEK